MRGRQRLARRRRPDPTNHPPTKHQGRGGFSLFGKSSSLRTEVLLATSEEEGRGMGLLFQSGRNLDCNKVSSDKGGDGVGESA
jgi:hypothetical protein